MSKKNVLLHRAPPENPGLESHRKMRVVQQFLEAEREAEDEIKM